MLEFLMELGLLVIGFVLLTKGADWFVEGAAGVADKFGIPQLVIGLTIVAMGTSAPEAAISIDAALVGNAGITVGNVVGSNILNVLIILGIASTITNIPVGKTTVRYEIPFMLGVTALFALLGYTGGEVNRFEGIILWICFLGYLGYMFFMCKKGQMQAEEVKKTDDPMWKLVIIGLIGLGLVVLGADITKNAATDIAIRLGVDNRFIGLTVVALGTSLPELVTSVIAARKGKADIAIGNIVGSNLFNILFVVGTSALIIPIKFASKFLIDCGVAFLAGVVLWLCVLRKKELTRWHGILMLLCYGAYFVYLVMS